MEPEDKQPPNFSRILYSNNTTKFTRVAEESNATSGGSEAVATPVAGSSCGWNIAKCVQLIVESDKPAQFYIGIPIDLFRLILLFVVLFFIVKILIRWTVKKWRGWYKTYKIEQKRRRLLRRSTSSFLRNNSSDRCNPLSDTLTQLGIVAVEIPPQNITNTL